MQIGSRQFTPAEISWIQDQVDKNPGLSRAALSRQFCQHVGWRKPDGGLKDMSCRVAMLRMDRQGVIRLPPPQRAPVSASSNKRTPQGEPGNAIHIKAGQAELSFEPVSKKTAPLYNELIDRYHYLGHRRMGGAQMRFFVFDRDQPVALLGFSAAAWKIAPRDVFIGWTDEQRRSRLHQVVDNSRFLLLPWVQSRNLASRILSLAARRLPHYWQKRYNYKPLLLETFVEKQRFAGTCYKAANWVLVGETLGRGKWDTRHQNGAPVKTIWLYPLDRRFREELCQ